MKQSSSCCIHPSAHVHPDAIVGEATCIGPGAVVGPRVRLGARCEIRAHAILDGELVLGDENQVGYGAVIGAEPQDKAFKAGCPSRTLIGHRNIFREHVTIHRGTKEGSQTEVGDDNFLMAGAHLAHNCRVGSGVILANGALCGGYVDVGDGAFLSGHSVVHQFCRVGRLAILRGVGRVSKDIPPFCIGDATNRLMGLNRVGLKRAGISPAARSALSAAIKTLFRSGQNLSQALASFDRTQAPAEVLELLEFIAAARKGVVFPPRQRCASEENGEES